MTDIDALATRHSQGSDVTGISHADGLVEVRATLPTGGDIIVNKISALPLQAKIFPTRLRKLDVIVTNLVIHSGLKIELCNITR